MASYEIEQGADGQWYWRVRSGNGQITGHGEGYSRRRDAKRGFRAHKRNVLEIEAGGAVRRIWRKLRSA